MDYSANSSSHQWPSSLGWIILAGLVSFVLGLLAAKAPAWADAPKPKLVVVNMYDKEPFYKPEKLTIKPGETVEWKNDGETVHSVSTTADNAQNAKDVSIPGGAQPFDSGFISPGGSFSYTFKVPGTYTYFCLPHEKAGMVGYVIVTK